MASIVEISKNDIDKIVGLYINPLNDRFMNVYIRNEKPFINVNGMRQDFQLYPTSENDFFVRWADIKFTFSDPSNDKPTKLTLSENGSDAVYERTAPKKSLVKEIETYIYNNNLNLAINLLENYNKALFELENDDFNSLGLKLIEDNKYDDALILFKKYTSLYSEDLRAIETLGTIYLNLSKDELALENFKKSSSLYSGDGFYQMALNSSDQYKPTKIPRDTSKIFEYRGNLKNKNIFIFLQGGPDPFLSIDNRRDPLYALPNRDDILRVYPYQSQMLNHSVFSPKSQLSEKDAAYERKTSAEIIFRIVDYFKKQGKTVHLLTHSFGSQLLLEYLEHNDNNADNSNIIKSGILKRGFRNYDIK